MAWLHVHYHSEILGMPVPMEVLLPQHIAGGIYKVDHPGPYPALYLLHGMGDDHTAWIRRSSIERYLENLPLAVIMPAGHLSWYTDMAYGKDYFKFITEELPLICERMFPLSQKRNDRFIAGISMGGYGAIKAGLLAPETFAAAASLSGALDPAGVFPSGIEDTKDIYDFIGVQTASDIFGDRHQLQGSPNDLVAAARDLAGSTKSKPQFYLWCGTEDFLYNVNVCFRDDALKLGLPLTYEEGPGDHQWKYWDPCIRRLLSWLPLNFPTSD